jgi:FkbM family methyltransferase
MDTKGWKDHYVKNGSSIEKELLEIFDKDSSPTIADIGSCDALDTVIYSRIFPNSKFHVFEPVVENQNECLTNLYDYGVGDRAILHKCALGSRSGKANFYSSYGQIPDRNRIGSWNKSGSLLRPRLHILEFPWCRFKDSSVRVERLDSEVCGDIDFAHIDVQGAEMDVLRGGERALMNCKAIWIEVANVELYKGQVLKYQLEMYLKSKDMKCMKDTCADGKYGDMLWVRQ